MASGIPSRPSAKGDAETSLDTSSKPKGKSDEGTGGAWPSRSKGRSRFSLVCVDLRELFDASSLGGSSSLPHVGHDEVPDETNPQIGHSYTVPAAGVHASRCRKRRMVLVKGTSTECRGML